MIIKRWRISVVGVAVALCALSVLAATAVKPAQAADPWKLTSYTTTG